MTIHNWRSKKTLLLNPKLLWRGKVSKIKCNQYWIFALLLNISVKNHAVICSIYQSRQRSIIDTRLVKQTYVDSRYLLTCVGNSWQKNTRSLWLDIFKWRLKESHNRAKVFCNLHLNPESSKSFACEQNFYFRNDYMYKIVSRTGSADLIF